MLSEYYGGANEIFGGSIVWGVRYSLNTGLQPGEIVIDRHGLGKVIAL